MKWLLFFFFVWWPILVVGQEGLSESDYNVGDTSMARVLLEEADSLLKKRELDLTLEKGMKAKDLFIAVLGEETKEVADCWHLLGKIYSCQENLAQAKTAYETVLAIRREKFIEPHPDVAASYNDLGVVYRKQGDYKKAIEYHEKALGIQLAILSTSHPDYSYNNLGSAYSEEKHYGKDINYYVKTLGSRPIVLSVSHLDVIASYNNLGNAYSDQGNYRKAIGYHEKVLGIGLIIFGSSHPCVATSYVNLGLIYYREGDYKKSIEYYEKALNIQLAVFDPYHPDVATSYHNLGKSYWKQGYYKRCTEFYERALEIRLAVLDSFHPDVATSYHNLGVAYQGQGDNEKGIEFYERALKIRLAVLGSYHPDVATSYNNLGVLYREQNNYRKAIGFHEKALEIQLAVLDSFHPDVATSYHILGVAYQEHGDNIKGIEYCEKALEIKVIALGSSHPDVAINYSNLGIAYYKQDNYEKSIEYHNRALTSLNFTTRTENISHINSVPYLIDILEDIGYIYHAQYLKTKKQTALSNAEYHIKQSLDVLNYQSKAIGLNSKTHLAQKSYDINNLAIATNYLLYQATDSIHYLHESFTFSENTKAWQLYETIQESDALSFSVIPDSLLEQEYDLRVDITFHEKQRQQKFNAGLSQTDSTVLATSGKLFDVRRDYEKLKTIFEEEYPDYYRLRYDLNTANVAEIQKDVLAENETLLEYFVGDSAIYIYTINQNDFQFHAIKKDFPLEEWIKDFRLANHDKKRTRDAAKNVENYHEIAHQLYQKLIAPVAEQLKEKVIIVPDGILGYLPFEALLVEPADEPIDWKNHHYWLRDKQISYCYSATLLKEMKEKQLKKKADKGVLALAPFYGTDTVLLTRALPYADPVDLGTLHPLPFSGEEVLGIREVLENTRVAVYTKKYATAAQFTKQASEYKVIHLATHGKADDKVGDYSFLVFAEQEDSTVNRFLYVRDLFNLQLNAEMVVLSACQTGIGELQKGEGIISLARGFTYAGTKSIVTSLWSVHDESTKDLMLGFYGYLEAGKTKDEALQLAKLDYLEAVPHGKAHPYYWSGFIGIGDMSSIVF